MFDYSQHTLASKTNHLECKIYKIKHLLIASTRFFIKKIINFPKIQLNDIMFSIVNLQNLVDKGCNWKRFPSPMTKNGSNSFICK